MPILVPALAHALPAVELKLFKRFTKEIEEGLVDGSLDAAIIAMEPEAPQSTSIPLYDELFFIALQNGHALSCEEGIDLGDLAGER